MSVERVGFGTYRSSSADDTIGLGRALGSCLQPGDVLETFSDMSDMKRDFGFTPKVDVEEGVRRYVAWFRQYYDR